MAEEVVSSELPVLQDDAVCLMLAGSVLTYYPDVICKEQRGSLLRELKWIVSMHPRPATFTDKLAVFLYEKLPQLSALHSWPQDIAPMIQALQRTAQDKCQPVVQLSETGTEFSRFIDRRNFLRVLLRHAPNLPCESVVAQLASFINDADEPIADAVLITSYIYRYLPLPTLLDDDGADEDEDEDEDEAIDPRMEFALWLTSRLNQALSQP